MEEKDEKNPRTCSTKSFWCPVNIIWGLIVTILILAFIITNIK